MSLAGRLYGYGVGVVYVLVGVVGFAYTGFGQVWVEANTGDHLLYFRLNGTHNLAHFLLGGALMVGAAHGEATARIVAAAIGLVYVALGVAGFWLTGAPDWNVLAINFADNVLHLVTGATALLAAFVSFSAARPRSGRRLRDETS